MVYLSNIELIAMCPGTQDEMYVFVNNKRMRCGHTTGTCAAAASKAAAMALLGEPVSKVIIATPKGITLDLPVEDLRIEDGKAS